MRFNAALISSLLFALAVLADRSRDHRLSQLHNPVEKRTNATSHPVRVVNSGNWAGAVWQQPAGTFVSVSGTFTVPQISGPIDSAAAAWVGIDGYACNVILQAGVYFIVTGDGPLYEAVYQWLPDTPNYFDTGFKISAGDNIRTTVSAPWNSTSGIAEIDNLSTGKSVVKYFDSEPALCQQNAEWIVEDYTQNFADFGTVTFTNAVAYGNGGPFGPFGAMIFDINQHDQYLTSVSDDGSSVTIKYVGT